MFDSLRRRRPRHGTVVAYLALFVALGGSSYAALRVGSAQIVDNSVRSKDIRNNDVRSEDVRNGSLLTKDFKAGQLPAGKKGDTGATGLGGATGAPGPPGVSGLEQVTGSSALDSTSPKTAFATCPAGKRVIGAAPRLTPFATPGANHLVIDDVNTTAETFVSVRAYEDDLGTAANWMVQAVAICANVS